MKKMTFDELNIAIVESVGLVVDEGGYILTDSGKNLTMNKLKIVIPTIANVKNKNEIIDGVITPKYTLFNPYSEDEIKRNQMLVLLMKYMSAISTSGIIDGVFRQLIELLANEEGQDTVSTHIKNFIIKLRELNGNRGNLMSKKRISDINKIVDYLLENNLNIIEYRLSKGETINGIKYNRLAKLDTVAIDKIKDNHEVIGVEEKSMIVFLAIIDFIIPKMDNKVSGSTSLRYPSATVALNIYNEVQSRINFLLEDLKDVFALPYESLTMPLIKEEIDLDLYKSDIEFLPNQNQLESSPVVNTTNATTSSTRSLLQDRLNSYGGELESVSNITPEKVNNTISELANDDDGLSSYIQSLTGGKNEPGFINRHNTMIHSNYTNPNVQGIAMMNNNGFNNNIQNGFINQQNGFANQQSGFVGNTGNIWG